MIKLNMFKTTPKNRYYSIHEGYRMQNDMLRGTRPVFSDRAQSSYKEPNFATKIVKFVKSLWNNRG